MKILAIETSAKSVAAAVVENGVPLASAYQNMGLTHSRTLMPLVDGMLSAAGLRVQDMDLLAAANGPGSFTGLRIGVSAAKGLAWAKSCPAAACPRWRLWRGRLRTFKDSSLEPWTPAVSRSTTLCSAVRTAAFSA